MYILGVRTAEPLYIVVVHHAQAEYTLRNWARDNKIKFVAINDSRMMLHHQQALDQLLVTWPHPWENVTIWDTWNRRHIYI